ncbi:MAG: T9SS type A sorting domain-containing protein [Bacteroidota bacterium]
MRQLLYFISFWAAFAIGIAPLAAASYTIQGQVTSEEAGTALNTVTVVVIPATTGEQIFLFPDADGNYTTTGDIAGNATESFLVAVLDLCSDQFDIKLVTVEAESSANLDFVICRAEGSTNGCNCPPEGEPVCVDFTGLTLPFPNLCEAECAGFGASFIVDCPEVPEYNDCGCEPDHQPVCVADSTGTVLFYENLCQAECNGYTSEDIVPCDNNNNNSPCGCQPDENPVCVEWVPGVVITFPSLCDAECYGFASFRFLDCDTGLPVGVPDCGCPADGEPVCVVNEHGFFIQYPNLCQAECEGYSEADRIDCSNNPYNCGCTPDESPVCVLGAPGVSVTFPSVCDALCFGFFPNDLVDCETGETASDCECPAEGVPVCIFINEVSTIQFDNICLAECAGYTEADVVECDPPTTTVHPFPCGCEAEAEPVCIQVSPGVIAPLPSFCDALCFGFDESYVVDCVDSGNPFDCGCSFDVNPVCVEVSPDITLYFFNACYAECAGYTEFVDCHPEQEEDPEEPPVANCGCSEVADPVCVEVQPGLIVPFLNACSAECAGYDPSEYTDCGSNFDHNNVFTHSYANPGEPSGLRSTELSPNPALDVIQLRTEWAADEENVEVQIFSAGGQLMKTLRYGAQRGIQQWTVGIDELPSGLYVLYIRSATGQEVQKFVKQ